MDLYFTRHAKNRMRWRGISKSEAEIVIAEPDKIDRLSEDKYNYTKIIKKRRIRVTVVHERKRMVIITALIR